MQGTSLRTCRLAGQLAGQKAFSSLGTPSTGVPPSLTRNRPFCVGADAFVRPRVAKRRVPTVSLAKPVATYPTIGIARQPRAPGRHDPSSVTTHTAFRIAQHI